jgi:hypothetical protein
MAVYAKGFIKSEDEFGCKWYEEVYLRPSPYCHFLRDSCRGVEKCPLIEVPEPHGALYDLNKIFEHLQNRGVNLNSTSPGLNGGYYIGYAPLIPASKEE